MRLRAIPASWAWSGIKVTNMPRAKQPPKVAIQHATRALLRVCNIFGDLLPLFDTEDAENSAVFLLGNRRDIAAKSNKVMTPDDKKTGP